MFNVNDRVQITNHSEPQCNGQYGTIISSTTAYDGHTKYYDVELDNNILCSCSADELMEG